MRIPHISQPRDIIIFQISARDLINQEPLYQVDNYVECEIELRC